MWRSKESDDPGIDDAYEGVCTLDLAGYETPS
jgi:hypothetical protein